MASCLPLEGQPLHRGWFRWNYLFGPVVHDTARVPFSGAVGLELGGVGLPLAVVSCGWVGERLLTRFGELAGLGELFGRTRQPVAGQHPVYRRVRHRARLFTVGSGALKGDQLAVPRPSQSAARVLASASTASWAGVGRDPLAVLYADRHRYQLALRISAISQNRVTVTSACWRSASSSSKAHTASPYFQSRSSMWASPKAVFICSTSATSRCSRADGT